MAFHVDLSVQTLPAFKAQRFRSQNAKIDTLLDSTIKFIIKNSNHFVGRPTNLFQNLPNTILQQIFWVWSQQMLKHEVDPDDINPSKYPLIPLLLNASVEEFYLQGWSKPDDHPQLEKLIAIADNRILKHALENCPNWQRAYINLVPLGNTLWEKLAKKMSTNWQKLKILTLKGNAVFKDSVTYLLRKNLSKSLDLLDSSRDDEKVILKQFTMEGVKEFAQMEQLESVSFQVENLAFRFTDAIWAHVAGHAPALKKMRFSLSDGSTLTSYAFVKHYGNLYPGKLLHIDCFVFYDDFEGDWPQNLRVDTVCFHGSKALLPEVLQTLPKPVKSLIITSSCAQKTADEAVEILGSNLSSLEITRSSLNINHLLSACPKLDKLLYGGQQNDTRIDLLTPQHFQNLKELHRLDCTSDDYEACRRLFKLFLLGSDHIYEKSNLYETCDGSMRAILDVLRLTDNNCKYYIKVQKAYLKMTNFQEPKGDLFELAYRLIANCPLLHTITIIYDQTVEADDKVVAFMTQSYSLKQFCEDFNIELVIELSY